jgi:TolB-like protein
MPESGDFTANQPQRSPAPDAGADGGRLEDVFVSYASDDAAVANDVVAALERNGLQCWIAPRDVPPGALYADVIIRAINSTKVLVLVLSRHSVASSHVGKEIERASAKKRPIIAMRTDTTPLTPALEYFLSESQWIDVGPAGVGPQSAKLAEAVRRLIGNSSIAGRLQGGDAGRQGEPAHQSESARQSEPAHRDEQARQGEQARTGQSAQAAGPALDSVRAKRRWNWPVGALIAVAVVALAYFAVDRLWLAKHTAVVGEAALPAAPANPAADLGKAAALPKAGSAAPAFAPPPHSIAVLPFVNMSGDPKQDYFSDGLSEELLNSLTTVRDLRVAARTSSCFINGQEVDLTDVGRKLNVGAVLEGSVRKDGSHVRITAQLIDAVTGFHLWSQTYDRDLKDILKLQTEIATAVTVALKATLMADAAASIELGGTQNPQAFDAYLRGKNLGHDKMDRSIALARIAAFDEAIRLDPAFAKAYASKAVSDTGFAEYYGVGPEIREHFQQARSAAERSVQLAPQLGEAHSALAVVLANGFLDFQGALAEHERALTLSPNDPEVLLSAAWFMTDIGRADEGSAMARRGVALDQLNARSYRTLAIVLDDAHQYREAIEAANRALSITPTDTRQAALRGLSLLALGEVEAARQSCETPPLDWESRLCLAITYDKLHRRSDAEAQLTALKADYGDASAYQYAEIYAQWGNVSTALDWIEKAYEVKDPGIVSIGVDEFFAPLRREPRFQEVLRKLNLPK